MLLTEDVSRETSSFFSNKIVEKNVDIRYNYID